MRNFRNLNIWKDNITTSKKVYHLAELLPLEEKYGLRSQISHAAISIPSNIRSVAGIVKSILSDF